MNFLTYLVGGLLCLCGWVEFGVVGVGVVVCGFGLLTSTKRSKIFIGKKRT